MTQLRAGLQLDRRGIVLGAFSLAACGGTFQEGVTSCAVKMSHYFLDDGAAVTAESVMRITWRERFRDSGAGQQFQTSVQAEAAFCAFEALGTVFVPLRSASDTDAYPIAVFLDQLVGFRELGTAERANAVRSIPNLKTEVEVPRQYLPLLITFKDINDPKTATELDPANMFPGSGRHVILQRSTLQVTDEAASDLIAMQLRWLPKLEGTLSGSPNLRPTGPAADRLSQVHFKTQV